MANSSSQSNMFASPLWLESAHGWPDGAGVSLDESMATNWILCPGFNLTMLSTALWYLFWCCFHKTSCTMILDPAKVATYNPDMTSVASK